MPDREIGGEFFEFTPDSRGALPFISGTYTSTGRGAITGVLRSLDVANKVAWLPAYTCETVITPFLREGYRVNFYNVTRNLCANAEEISAIKGNGGVFLFHPYFGFETFRPLRGLIEELCDRSWHVVADISHAFLSVLRKGELDSRFHYACSLRKWMALPDGGWTSMQIRTAGVQEDFFAVRMTAAEKKLRYLRERSTDAKEKEKYLRLFQEADEIINRESEPYAASSLTLDRLSATNFDRMAHIRCENYRALLQSLRRLKKIRPVFSEAQEDEVPMFFPLFVEGGRERFRNALREQRIYCPIHWPTAEYVKEIDKNTRYIFNNVISIPIDQRYGIEDMERVAAQILKLDKGFA